jgi:hypothetical protein
MGALDRFIVFPNAGERANGRLQAAGFRLRASGYMFEHEHGHFFVVTSPI